jgi:hypothetical protein
MLHVLDLNPGRASSTVERGDVSWSSYRGSETSHDELDAVVVGEQYGLEPELAVALWRQASDETARDSEVRTPSRDLVWSRFHDLAARHLGTNQVRKAPGKVSRIDARIDGERRRAQSEESGSVAH